MTANTVYEVFKALPFEERQQLTVLVNQHKEERKTSLGTSQKTKTKFTKQDGIDYLLATVFKNKI
jgi:Asp-tRNA(Asn)/Glu-tRNA(Gln) amidotransferase B subunit